jgi:hypothetical protein
MTTGFIFIADANDFFPDIISLYDNMGDSIGIPNANDVGSSSAPYVFCSPSSNLSLDFLY